MAKLNGRAIDIEEVESREEMTEPAPTSEEISQHVPVEIFVTYPEQLFSPAPYNSFRVGGITAKTFTKPGESVEAAYRRLWKELESLTRKQYLSVKKDFWERYESMAV